MLVVYNFKGKEKTRKLVKCAVKKCAIASRNLITVCLGTCMVLLFLTVYFHDSLVKPEIKATSEDTGRYELSKQKDVILDFKDDNWKKLDTQKKMNDLQDIANIEREHLGIPYAIEVQTSYIDQRTIANYDDSEHVVTVDPDDLRTMGGMETLEVMLHEMFHSCQHSQIEAWKTVDEKYKDLYIFQSAKLYEYKSKNYITGKQSVEGYLSQALEQNA